MKHPGSEADISWDSGQCWHPNCPHTHRSSLLFRWLVVYVVWARLEPCSLFFSSCFASSWLLKFPTRCSDSSLNLSSSACLSHFHHLHAAASAGQNQSWFAPAFCLLDSSLASSVAFLSCWALSGLWFAAQGRVRDQPCQKPAWYQLGVALLTAAVMYSTTHLRHERFS